MSLLSIALPVQAVIPAAEAIVGSVAPIARPLLGLSAVVAVLMIFKPLLLGLLRAALLVVKPRQTVEQQAAQRKLSDVLMLNSMARDLDATQPNLAAELRVLAGRD